VSAVVAHWSTQAGVISVDGNPLATVSDTQVADAVLGNAGYELIGEWMPTNLGSCRLVVLRKVASDGS
jgi:hypothetical protein